MKESKAGVIVTHANSGVQKSAAGERENVVEDVKCCEDAERQQSIRKIRNGTHYIGVEN